MVGPAQKVGIVVEIAVFAIVVLLITELLEFSGLQGLGLVVGLLLVLAVLALVTRLSFTVFDLLADGAGKTRNALRHRRK